MLPRPLAGAVLFTFAVAVPVGAGQAPPDQPKRPDAPAQQQAADQQPPAEESPVYKEQIVVTASKTEQALVNAPATVSLISGQTLQNNGATSYADLFRAVPGLNVT